MLIDFHEKVVLFICHDTVVVCSKFYIWSQCGSDTPLLLFVLYLASILEKGETNMNVVWELFTAFLKIGFLSIGGGYAVIPMSQEQVVEKNSWISEKMFTDIITISQMTPGPLAVNTSTFVGLQVGGTVGALAATIGCNHWLHLVRGCYFTGFLPFFSKPPAIRLCNGSTRRDEICFLRFDNFSRVHDNTIGVIRKRQARPGFLIA